MAKCSKVESEESAENEDHPWTFRNKDHKCNDSKITG